MAVLLTLPADLLAFIVAKARGFDALVEVDDPDSGSNPADDGGIASLEDTTDNPVEAELTETLRGLSEEALTELLALLWVGRGDFNRRNWIDALHQARETKNRRIVSYLAGTPMLGDLIEEGLAELGYDLPLPVEDRSG